MTNKPRFLPKEYIFKPAGDDLIEMTVFGELIGRPSKRLALYQNKLKVVTFRGKTFEEIKKHIESGLPAPVGLYWPSFGEIGSEVALSAA
jgi:hypothetical protein